MNEIFDKIAKIIEDVADIPREDIHLESSLIEDLDLASLEVLAILSKIENEYDIQISEEELLSIETVNDIVTRISEKK